MAEGRVKSNETADKLKLYAGIGVAGIATGAAIAVKNDPMYDLERKIRGKEPIQRKAPWDRGLTKPMLRSSVDSDMYDLHIANGQYAEAFGLENQARRNFHAEPYEHQLELLERHRNATSGSAPKGTLAQRMMNKLRRARRL